MIQIDEKYNDVQKNMVLSECRALFALSSQGKQSQRHHLQLSYNRLGLSRLHAAGVQEAQSISQEPACGDHSLFAASPRRFDSCGVNEMQSVCIYRFTERKELDSRKLIRPKEEKMTFQVMMQLSWSIFQDQSWFQGGSILSHEILWDSHQPIKMLLATFPHSQLHEGYVEEFAAVLYPSATALLAVQRRRHVKGCVCDEASKIG